MARTKLKLKSIASGTLPGALKIATENITAGAVDSDAMGAGAISPAKLSTTSQSLTNRNLIINGNFVVAQRGTSFSNVTSSQFCLDRFSADIGGGGAFNVTQDTSAPEGFEKSLKIEVHTADSSIGAGDSFRVTQAIEGQNTAQVELGASTAKAMTLSFYVKSSVTGTYGVGLANSAETENFVAEYTISSADTWEKKTINIPVRTSGTWLTTNGIGIGVRFDLGSGTDYNGTAGQWQTTSAKVYRTSSCVNLIATGSATWFLTGVQLEVGDTATEFEHEPFETTLRKCQRYYQKTFVYAQAPVQDPATTGGTISGPAHSDSAYKNICQWWFQEVMRTSPTITTYNPYFSNGNWAKSGYDGPTAALYSSSERMCAIRDNGGGAVGTNLQIHADADAEL